MSRYGELWEKVSRIRAQLKTIIPSASTDTLENAKKSAGIHVGTIETLLRQWEMLEEEMKLCDPHTGQ